MRDYASGKAWNSHGRGNSTRVPQCMAMGHAAHATSAAGILRGVFVRRKVTWVSHDVVKPAPVASGTRLFNSGCSPGALSNALRVCV